MLFCLKPSEQVQYLQLSFEDRDNMFPAFCRMGLLGVKDAFFFAISALFSISTLKVVSRREDTGTWQ